MDQNILVTTNYVLTRTLKEFAIMMGLHESYADLMAQVHIQTTQIPKNWDRWFGENCANCTKDPNECDFMNPKESNCRGGATPETVQQANFMVVEMGKMRDCPALRIPTQSDETSHKNSAGPFVPVGENNNEQNADSVASSQEPHPPTEE